MSMLSLGVGFVCCVKVIRDLERRMDILEKKTSKLVSLAKKGEFP